MTLKYSTRQSNSELISLLFIYLFFGIFCFIYLYKIVQPEILYFRLQPFFSTDQAYREFLINYRLGNISLLAQFILQFLYYPVFGTILLTIILLFTSLTFRIIINRSFPAIIHGIEFIPVIIILSSLKYYSGITNTLVLFSISGILLLINHLLGNLKVYFRLTYSVLALIISFYIFGSSTSLMVFICFVTYELLNYSSARDKILIIIINVFIISLIIWKIPGNAPFKLSLSDMSSDNKYAMLPDYWYLFCFYPIAGVVSKIFKIKIIDKTIANGFQYLPGSWYFFIIFTVVISLSFKKAFVNEKKYLVLVDFYAEKQEWEKVLKLKDHLVIDDRIARFQMNRALFHLGRMADHLFTVPQEWGESALILTKDANRESNFHSSNLYFDMGYINGSRYWAFEAQTYNPYSPLILKRLALTSLILKDYDLGYKYLTILNQNFIYKKWAESYLELMEVNDTSKLKLKLKQFPANNTDSIIFINNQNPVSDLIVLVKKNNNKMAFEYLMSYFLLRNEVGNLKYFLKYLDSINYSKIPEIYQEALLFSYIQNGQDPTKQEYPVDISCLKKFESFNKVLFGYKMNKKLAQKDLYRIFSDTYWYYLAYDSPLISNRKVKKRTL